MTEMLESSYLCGYCGELNEALVDPSGGSEQAYTEDCTVCCRPNALRVRIAADRAVTIDVEYEG